MYERWFKLALDIVNEHGSYEDFIAASPIYNKESNWEIPVSTRKLIWEMACYCVNVWLRE